VSKAPSSPRTASATSSVRTHRPRARRARRKREAASALPLRCVVLAVDTAANSGWAICRGQDDYLCFGEVDTLDEPSLNYIVVWAVTRAAQLGLPLVLVLEAPFGGPVRTLLGLGAAGERWRAAWRRAGQAGRTVLVQPAEWRAPVLGRRWARAPRDEVRAHEQATAASIVGERTAADESAAILIARWGLRAAKVSQVLR
jgi:hypothetical protein